MNEFAIEHGIRIGNDMAAVLIGSGAVHIGDSLRYPSGKRVVVTGIGSGRTINGEIDVLLAGEIDEGQQKVVADSQL